MLTFRQIDDIPDAVLEIIGETEQTIIDDMARRVARLGRVTEATVYQMERLQAVSASHDHVVRELTKALDKTEAELTHMFDEAATRTLRTDDSIYRAAGYSPIPLDENHAMQQIIRAGLAKTMGEFRNLTSTTARTATQQFENALDLAHMQIVTGGMDYKSAVKAGIRSLTENGIASIRYPTGHIDHLDVAFRRAALTGVSQTAAKVQEQRLDEMGCNVVETSAHGGARTAQGTGPDNHAWWQGRRFFWSEKGGENPWGYPDFIQSTGLGSGPGLCGWNCRHSWYPVPDPDAPTANSAAHLNDLNNRTVTYNGKEMTLYDATQRQRHIERQIRRWKREENAMDAAGLDSDYARQKVREWQARQRDFIDQTGLRRDYFRERAGAQMGPYIPREFVAMRYISVGRSLGAKAKNYDIFDPETGITHHLAEGSRIHHVQVFAGRGTKTPLHDGVAEGLTEQFGGDVNKWQHVKGYGIIDINGEEIQAELHWFQEETVGKVKWKIKSKIW